MTDTHTQTQTEYAICETRYYYGPRTTKARLTDEYGEEWRGTHAEARTRIAELDDTPYELAHGESGRPTHTIVRASR